MATILKAVRIFNGKSDELLRNSCIVVEGNKIAALPNSARLPSSAELIDLGDVTLCPGFIDAHTHLTWDFASYSQSFIDRFRLSIPERAYRAAANAAKTLQAGFTTVREVGSSDSSIPGCVTP